MSDPTLDAVDAALVSQQERIPRPYLGASILGRECARELWYSFRWCGVPEFDATTLKRFADGHYGEDVQANRLRLVPGVELKTHDADGNQYGVSAVYGHVKGHMDGVIKGLLHDPNTMYVWEHKQVGEDKQRKLELLIYNALSQWDRTYYTQAQIYMGLTGIHQHYLTCANPGGRHTISVITKFSQEDFDNALTRAEMIIRSTEPMQGISKNPTFWQCKFCDAKAICHEHKTPLPSCRTCIHSSPVLGDDDAIWHCEKYGCDVSLDVQRTSHKCPSHLFMPVLITWAKQVDADENANTITYEMDNGEMFTNGPKPFYASSEIHKASSQWILSDEFVTNLRHIFDAEVIG